MTKKSNESSTLIDEFFSAITENPIHLLITFLVVLGCFFSTLIMFLALAFFIIMQRLRLFIKVMTLITGFCMMFIAWWVGHVNPTMLHQYNLIFYRELLDGQLLILHEPFVWLAALPYGIILGTSLSFIVQFSKGPYKDLKRVSQGRHLLNKVLSDKRITRAINKLPQAACVSGTVLGIDRHSGNPVILSDTSANLPTLFIGTTGSGKTTGLMNIVESAIQRSHPLFFVDGKGDSDLARRIGRYAKSQNRPFYLFSMLGESITYNPIASGGFTSKKDRLIELRHWSEDYYRKQAERYLQTVFKILEHCQIDINLSSLGIYLEENRLYQLVRQHKGRVLDELVQELDIKRESIEGMISEIKLIVDSEIGHLFQCDPSNTLDLSNALREDAIVYFCLQPLLFPVYADTLGKLVINDIKSVLASQLDTPNPKKLMLLFDEFSVFAGTQITHLINQGRSAGAHTVLSTQSLSDVIEKGSKALLGQVLNNTNNYFIQRQNNPEDANMLAEIIGTKESYDITSQVSDGGSNRPTGSVRLTREYIVHPDEIKRLRLGQAFFVSKQPFSIKNIQFREGLKQI